MDPPTVALRVEPFDRIMLMNPGSMVRLMKCPCWIESVPANVRFRFMNVPSSNTKWPVRLALSRAFIVRVPTLLNDLNSKCCPQALKLPRKILVVNVEIVWPPDRMVSSKLRMLTNVCTVNVPSAQVTVSGKVNCPTICRLFPDETVVMVIADALDASGADSASKTKSVHRNRVFI